MLIADHKALDARVEAGKRACRICEAVRMLRLFVCVDRDFADPGEGNESLFFEPKRSR